MTCPFAIAAVITYCSGTPEACNPGQLKGLHLFEATQDIIEFDTEPGAKYEVFLPPNGDDRGAWHLNGLTPDAGVPTNREAIDPFALAGYYRYGTFEATAGASSAKLQRLAGSDRIGVCRVDVSDEIKAVSWLALPLSRSAYTIWNQPLDDTPSFPLPWLACFAACLALTWAEDTKGMRKPIPQDFLVTVLRASTLADIITWIALAVVVLEDSAPTNSNAMAVIGAYTGLLLLALLIRQIHFSNRGFPFVHLLLGFAALLTSVFYVTTALFWIWAVVLLSSKRWKRVNPDTPVEMTSLLF